MIEETVPATDLEPIDRRRLNLRPPWKPGESGNPQGVNQYTYRRDFETSIGRLLSGELSESEARQVAEWVQASVKPGMPRGEALAHITVVGALRGEETHLMEALKRIWPAITKAEVAGAEGQPLVPGRREHDFTMLTEEDRATIQKIAAKVLMSGTDE